jgi:PAS domain S-box-containing protein
MNDQLKNSVGTLEAVRRAEQKYRSIFEHCLEGIFQTTPEGKYISANPALARMYGSDCAKELISDLTDISRQLYVEPGRRSEFIRLVRENGKVLEFESQIYRRDGSVIWISESARVVHDEISGEVLYYEGMVQDITRHKAAEEERDQANARLSVQYAVARTLAEVRHLGEASHKIVQAICESVGWEFGDIWRVDPEADCLRCVDVWHNTQAPVEEFVGVTRKMTFEAGIGLPGRVWSSRKAFWLPDVHIESNSPRAALAVKAGLHTAFAFPIMLGSELIGVMEFFSSKIHPPDDELLSMLSALGTQIGSFVQREQLANQLQRYEESRSAA